MSQRKLLAIYIENNKTERGKLAVSYIDSIGRINFLSDAGKLNRSKRMNECLINIAEQVNGAGFYIRNIHKIAGWMKYEAKLTSSHVDDWLKEIRPYLERSTNYSVTSDDLSAVLLNYDLEHKYSVEIIEALFCKMLSVIYNDYNRFSKAAGH